MDEWDFSEAFYRQKAERYAEVSRLGLQSRYLDADHPGLRCDQDLIERLTELIPPPARGLDAGCGAEARDAAWLCSLGYDILAIDAVEEVVKTARRHHPEMAERIRLADLRKPLPVSDASLDFIICNAVIQHISPQQVWGVVFPGFSRALRRGGILLLMFKNGRGILRMYDPDYATFRTFILYEEGEVLQGLKRHGLVLIEKGGGRLGGMMHFRDGKGAAHAVGFWRKLW